MVKTVPFSKGFSLLFCAQQNDIQDMDPHIFLPAVFFPEAMQDNCKKFYRALVDKQAKNALNALFTDKEVFKVTFENLTGIVCVLQMTSVPQGLKPRQLLLEFMMDLRPVLDFSKVSYELLMKSDEISDQTLVISEQ